jgi:tetratricopeptide (TPR) repeat protein
MQGNSRKTAHTIPLSRRIIYYFLIVLFSFFFLAALEVVLRLTNTGKDYSLFIDNPQEGLEEYRIENPEIGAKYFHELEYTTTRNDLFLKQKDKNSFRIFVLGSSSVVGFPYDQNLMFTRILQYRLQLAYPGKKIEVINTAITAINSYTLLDFTNEILAEKPDALLIYAGHNEFYGAFGIGSNEGIGRNRLLVRAHLKLMNLRIYQLLRKGIDGLRGSKHGNAMKENKGTLMSKIVKNPEIRFGSSDYTAGIEQFRANMGSILQKASDKQVPVFISTLVSNIKDIKPFGSTGSLPGDRADSTYVKAAQAESAGDFKEAKKLYTRAKDLDCIRFRASEDINETILSLAKEFNANLVPAQKIFEDSSPHRIIGSNLITEHVHPNIQGYFLLADGFYNALVNSKLIAPKPDMRTVESYNYVRRTYGYTELDSLLGYHRIANLRYHWPFRDDSKNYIDYRLIYKPVSLVDTLAFSIMAAQRITSVDAHQRLAKTYLAQGEITKASKEYKAIMQLVPTSPELSREAASCFLSEGDLPLALNWFTNSLKYAKHYFAYFRIGEIYFMEGDYESAASFFTKAYELGKPEYKVRILSKLFQSYTYLGRKNEAGQVLNIIRQIEPRFNAQVPARAFMFANYFPVSIFPQVEKAKKIIKDGDLGRGIKMLIGTLEINDSPIVNRLIGELYLGQKDYKSAVLYFGKAYPFNKFDPTFLSMAIRTYLGANELELAQECYYQLKIVDPRNPQLAYLKMLLFKTQWK